MHAFQSSLAVFSASGNKPPCTTATGFRFGPRPPSFHHGCITSSTSRSHLVMASASTQAQASPKTSSSPEIPRVHLLDLIKALAGNQGRMDMALHALSQKHGNVFQIRALRNLNPIVVSSRDLVNAVFKAPESQLSFISLVRFSMRILADHHERTEEMVRLNSVVGSPEKIAQGFRKSQPLAVYKSRMEKVLDEKIRSEQFLRMASEDFFLACSQVIVNCAISTIFGEAFERKHADEFWEHYFHMEMNAANPLYLLYPNAPLPFHKKVDQARSKVMDMIEQDLRRRIANPNPVIDDYAGLILSTLDIDELKTNPKLFRTLALHLSGIVLAMHINTTSSAALSFVRWASDVDYLKRAIQEADKADFADLSIYLPGGLPFMESVWNETIRRTSNNITWRVSVEDFALPNTPYVAPKSSIIIVDLLSIHWNPQVYPNPLQFDADRWSQSPNYLVERVKMGDLLKFGIGTHPCLGNRFAEMQLKMFWLGILKNYNVECVTTKEDLDDLAPSKFGGMAQPKKPLRLKFSPRQV